MVKTIGKQMRRKTILFCLLLMNVSFLSAQNQVKISGKVTDANNEPMIGVSVVEKGTANGITTDANGAYALTVRSGVTIVFSYIGYVPQERRAIEGILNITMEEDTKALEEVVVVGYGVQKKSSVTGAISQVKAEDIQNRTITRPEQALQGKTAGVQVVQTSGAPGKGPAVRVRGYSSNSSSSPLFVVDGIRLPDIGGIDPNDIESIEVLKDAASAAIYGAEAGNGVVLITTKRGSMGFSKISYDLQWTNQSLARIPKMLNSEEYIDHSRQVNQKNKRIFSQNR
jgi:TonB-dependent SusC/RagA subfamily outer membrane receptor